MFDVQCRTTVKRGNTLQDIGTDNDFFRVRPKNYAQTTKKRKTNKEINN